MVTGKTPFSGKTPSEVMRGHLKTPLRAPDELNPTLSSGFCQIIEMCMGKELSERYESMTDLIEDLELVKQGDSPHFAKPAVDLSTLTLQSDPGMPSAGSSSGTNGVVRRDQGNSLADNPLLLISLAGNAILILILILVVVTSN